jgi:hypothetical protein
MPGDLARSVAVRPATNGWRRDVRAGGRPIPQLWRANGRGLCGVLRACLGLADLAEWVAAALIEPEQIEELDVEF